MNSKIYKNDIFDISIQYMTGEIIINVINEHSLVYENIINEANIKNICIFDFSINNIDEYYYFLTNAFENLEKFKIEFSNKNNRFIKITIKEKIYDEYTIKNILWIKNKRDYELITNEVVNTIILNENYFYMSNNENDNIIKDSEDNVFYNYIINICKRISDFLIK